MGHSVLITQCLQNDFVKPIGRHEPMPNALHVGYEEARRLMGEDPAQGPVARMMQWAYEQGEEALTIIHIRDWHDPASPGQAEHLRQFGPHCLIDTEGARFAFDESGEARRVALIDSPGLNDFVGTDLERLLERFAAQPVIVGLVGVWTEAKIMFLAYDLRTRYPEMQLAVCSALAASSSRARHFEALDQLQRLLGVRVFSSIGEFTRFLSGSAMEVPLAVPSHADTPGLALDDDSAEFTEADRTLLRYLFRDCRSVRLRMLDGGYSGNLVLNSESVDQHGQVQVPHVVKIGEEVSIGLERSSFERIESVLGNNAPRIVDFADFGGRGALKYRYAAMGGGFSTTFQKLYCAGLPRDKVERFLTEVFVDQLGRFYAAAELEKCNLLEYYEFRADLAPLVRKLVEDALGETASAATLRFGNGRSFPNPYVFYAHELPRLLPQADGSNYFAHVHGDLNGANIMIDAHENVWLIDFFHTHRGHVLKDLVKFENDLLYIFTPLHSERDLDEACRLTDLLFQVEDLARPLPGLNRALTNPNLVRAYETVQLLRSFYPALVQYDRDPIQLLIAQLRYAMHTLSFEESNDWQKRWALYTGGRCSMEIAQRMLRSGPLRVDWIDRRHTREGRLGLSILPGRGDFGRKLSADVESLQRDGVTHILCLITPDEIVDYGVDDLLLTYEHAGFVVRRLPIFDQRACSAQEMRELTAWLSDSLDRGASVLVHCVGGLGRSGTVAACYLKTMKLSTDQAIAEVRRARSQRAIESRTQEEFIESFVA